MRKVTPKLIKLTATATVTATALVTATATSTVTATSLPLHTPPLCTVGWFAKTEIVVFGNQPNYYKSKQIKNLKKYLNTKKKFLIIATLAIHTHGHAD